MGEELLMVRYLSGEATPEEAIQLESWLAAAAVNQEAFNELWQSWQYTAPEPYVTPVTGNDWQLLRQRWQKAGLPAGPGSFIAWLLKALPAMLCCVAVVAAGVWLLRNHFNKPATPVVTAAATAVVKDTLAEGLLYTLDVNSRMEWYAPARQLVLQGGIMLQNTIPVQLSTGKVLLTVTPGYFYVNYDSTQQQTTIYVAEGTVTIHTANGDTAITKEASVLVDEKRGQWLPQYVVNKNRFSFATRHFYFDDTPLTEVAAYLQKAYGITITLAHPAIGNCRLTGQFNYVPVRQILDMLALTLPITYVYKESEQTIYLAGDGCK